MKQGIVFFIGFSHKSCDQSPGGKHIYNFCKLLFVWCRAWLSSLSKGQLKLKSESELIHLSLAITSQAFWFFCRSNLLFCLPFLIYDHVDTIPENSSTMSIPIWYYLPNNHEISFFSYNCVFLSFWILTSMHKYGTYDFCC